jgi:hypothetical protein
MCLGHIPLHYTCSGSILREVLGLTPARILQNRMEIRSAGVEVLDIGRKVLDGPLGGLRRRSEQSRDCDGGGEGVGEPE